MRLLPGNVMPSMLSRSFSTMLYLPSASTLELIGEYGGKAFYEGEVGMYATMPKILTQLTNYHSKLHYRSHSRPKWNDDS
jgi:hypothetical protein